MIALSEAMERQRMRAPYSGLFWEQDAAAAWSRLRAFE
jgi:hypothetical protein